MQDAKERGGAAAPQDPPAASLDVAFHQLFYSEARFADLTWRGVPLVKHPMDLAIFAEIIHRTLPRVIVETGTRAGGSALYFADMMTVAGVPNPRVITIDTEPHDLRPADPRIVYLRGRSTSTAVLDEVHAATQGRTNRMVVLDSDHSAANVEAELIAYSYLVTPGAYLVVEDTNTGGNPVESPDVTDGGPAVGIARWLPSNPRFRPDPRCERFGQTFNPGGWLVAS